MVSLGQGKMPTYGFVTVPPEVGFATWSTMARPFVVGT